MKKLLFIILAISSPLFGQTMTQKVNNVATIYGANSSLVVNGQDMASNITIRGTITQSGSMNGSSNTFLALTNVYTGVFRAKNASVTHGLGGLSMNNTTWTADSSSALLGLGGGQSTLGVRVINMGMTVTNNLSVSNNFTVGQTTTLGTNGSAIVFHKTATASLDFGNILAAGTADLTITVGGAAENDSVILGRPTDEDASLATRAFVSGANTVTVRANNVGTIAVDQASKTYRVDVIHY